jgi:trigger factor
LRVEVEALDSTQVKLEIEVPAEEVDEALQEAYQVLRGYVSLPGFRKGRVPLAILKSRFPEHINAEVVKQLIFPAYEDALVSKRLIPLAQPTFDPPLEKLEATENQPLVFTATVNVKPTFEVPSYEQLETDKTPVNVPREDVEAHIERLQLQSATFEPIEEDRLVQESDCVRIDWICTVDGKELENESAQDIDIDLTSKALHADLIAGLIGMQVGETKPIEVSFGTEHRVPSLAGKRATYNVTLHAITLKHLPGLDDEFAKDLGYETYNQMHGVIWNNLVENERILHIEKQKGEILEQLIEKTDITIPDELVEQYVQQAVQNVQKQLKAQQQTPEEMGIDLETLPSELRKSIIQQTKQNWIFDEIAEFESIYVSDDELELEIRRAAEQMNRDTQKYADLLKASNGLEDFRVQLQHEKIYQFLIEEASEKKSLIITG